MIVAAVVVGNVVAVWALVVGGGEGKDRLDICPFSPNTCTLLAPSLAA